MHTKGISPKVIADLAVTVITFLVTAGVIQLDPVASAALSKVLGTLAGVVASPGEVTVNADDVGAPFRASGPTS